MTPYALYNPATHVAVPKEPTQEMFANTCDEHGRPAILKYTQPDERGQAYLMPRYIYRAMLAAAPPHAVEIDPTRSDVALAKLILERIGYSVEGGQHRVDLVAEEICKFREAK